ncbi:MAG: ABC-F type ribosomal protection protein [Clostridiaceae bacterium]|nr:ABC-F type ribosomal protection protein [Clostridiaceae bacterium]
MLLLDIKNIKKYYGERLILDAKDFKAYYGEIIGIVGANGSGKTTFLDIIAGRNIPEEGSVNLYGEISYITQLDLEAASEVNNRMAKEFNLGFNSIDTASGGEKTRFKIASSLSENSSILLADEPTSNLDIQGIELLEKRLAGYKGLILIVSHDRELLDKLCSSIVEIEGGKLKRYSGGYSQYKQQKDAKFERTQFEYHQYTENKKALEDAIKEKKSRTASMKKAPGRMGNSEARLHKMGNQKAKGNIDKAIKAMETRISKLEAKEKPKEQLHVKIDMQDAEKLVSRILISGKGITKAFGSKELFREAEFEIPNGSKTALLGGNGTGKSTLLNMIMGGDMSIKLANGTKLGYFRQGTDILEDDETILENVTKDSIYPEYFVRTILARLLFKKDDVYKKAGNLSGGERVRTCFAKIFCSDANVIVLDEPTNYLDISSMEAVENAMKLFEGTIFFASHDRKLISSTADRIIFIEDFRLNTFEGSYGEYIDSGDTDINKKKLLLDTRLSEVISRLSMPGKGDDVEQLDMEYKKILAEIRQLETSK